MKRKNYKYIILFITITIVATISLQLYWNMKNYKENKARLINEVQIALDNSLESYYTENAKKDFIAFEKNNKLVPSDDFFKSYKKESPLTNHPNNQNKKTKKRDSILAEAFIKQQVNLLDSTVSESDRRLIDSILSHIKLTYNKDSLLNKKIPNISPSDITQITIKSAEKTPISVSATEKQGDTISKITNLAFKVVSSFMSDTINFKKLNVHLIKELKRKNITITYAFKYFKSDSLIDQYGFQKKAELPLKTFSKSTYLMKPKKLELAFSNPMALILKRSITEIILSFLLSMSIIFCLLYLLRTINKQKKIDEIKNDLISNITHEFKTPITTIATAIEGIKSFNSENDVEKTNRYLNISSNQLQKLEAMVERLLETASLDTNQLKIKKEKTDLLPILTNCIEKHQLNNPEKSVVLQSDFSELVVNIDAFHIENAISNLIDNAVKYGGNTITISLHSDQKNTSILVEDNGIGIDKSLKERIFEKFYRIPKGNIHDVKGFGIGLFYSKKIIEKHGGILELVSNCNPTLFKISLHNEN